MTNSNRDDIDGMRSHGAAANDDGQPGRPDRSDRGAMNDEREGDSASERIDESGKAKDDPSRAPESGTT